MIDVAMRLDRSASGDDDHRAAAAKKVEVKMTERHCQPVVPAKLM